MSFIQNVTSEIKKNIKYNYPTWYEEVATPKRNSSGKCDLLTSSVSSAFALPSLLPVALADGFAEISNMKSRKKKQEKMLVILIRRLFQCEFNDFAKQD